MIVITEAFLVIATQPTDSPYVVLGQIPKTVPAIEPTPSPRRVLLRPGSLIRSLPIIEERFLWSAICSAKTTRATGRNAITTSAIPPAVITPAFSFARRISGETLPVVIYLNASNTAR